MGAEVERQGYVRTREQAPSVALTITGTVSPYPGIRINDRNGVTNLSIKTAANQRLTPFCKCRSPQVAFALHDWSVP